MVHSVKHRMTREKRLFLHLKTKFKTAIYNTQCLVLTFILTRFFLSITLFSLLFFPVISRGSMVALVAYDERKLGRVQKCCRNGRLGDGTRKQIAVFWSSVPAGFLYSPQFSLAMKTGTKMSVNSAICE